MWKFLVTKTSAKTSSWGKRTFFFSTKFFQKCSWGSETHAQIFFGGGGGGADFGVFGAPHAPTQGSHGVEK